MPELVPELLELPDGLDAVTATFIEPLACVLRAQDRAGLRAGDSLLVVGAGVNGLLQIAAAHARGVEAVWVREPRPERLELAEAWGAEHHGNELVDVAIVCTPKPEAIERRPPTVAPGGTLCLYAPPSPHAPPQLDATALYLREITVAGQLLGRTRRHAGGARADRERPDRPADRSSRTACRSRRPDARSTSSAARAA